MQTFTFPAVLLMWSDNLSEVDTGTQSPHNTL